MISGEETPREGICSTSADMSELFRRFEHVLGMARYPNIAPDAGDLAVPVDQEGRADDAHIFVAEHRLFAPDAVGFDRIALLVGEQGHRKPVFRFELPVLF